MNLPQFLQPVPPDVAVEVEATHVAAARLDWRGATATVTAHTIERLPAGVVVPALAAPNITDVAVVGRALTQALSRLGGRTRRVALVIPDTTAKVSLVRFENVPPKAADLDELVRWQIKKTSPFPLDDAIVSYTPGLKHPDGQEFVVAAARQDIVQQYEQACTSAGAHPGLVDLATFSIINGVLSQKALLAGDWLLVHVTGTYTTLAVIREGSLIFFRNRASDEEGTLADLVHQTAMYYEDRLQGAGFARVFLAGAAIDPAGADAVRRSLEERLGLRVEAVDPRAAASVIDRISPSADLLDALAPLVGILLRERKALRLADARSGQAAL
jgi:type IV pilus assembly protein PilM